jgi:hypothetical protein
MASVATSNISNISYNQSKISISGFAVEHFRIAAGQTVGDTATITPVREKLIKGVWGPCANDLPATGASSVVITLGLVSSAVTQTIGQVDVFLICQPR